MTNELLKAYITKKCKLSSGSMENSLTGVLRSLNENWLEVETSNGIQLVNTDFIQKIKIIG